ncbi:MAG: hypothetical protein ACUVQG_10585 [Thermogutta sp.]
MSIQFDFLPPEYHEIYLRRRSVPLLALVSLLVFSLGVGTLVVQMQANRQLRKTHQELTQAWQQTRNQIAQRQQQLAKRDLARKKSRVLKPILVGYPRSWLLEAVFRSVPKDVVIDRLSLSLKEEVRATTSQKNSLQPVAYNSEDTSQDPLLSFQRGMENAAIDLMIAARTVAATAVDDFLTGLAHDPLFEEVNLRTVEGTGGDGKDSGTTRFELVLRSRHLPNPSAFVHPRQLQFHTEKSPPKLEQLANKLESP